MRARERKSTKSNTAEFARRCDAVIHSQRTEFQPPPVVLSFCFPFFSGQRRAQKQCANISFDGLDGCKMWKKVTRLALQLGLVISSTACRSNEEEAEMTEQTVPLGLLIYALCGPKFIQLSDAWVGGVSVGRFILVWSFSLIAVEASVVVKSLQEHDSIKPKQAENLKSRTRGSRIYIKPGAYAALQTLFTSTLLLLVYERGISLTTSGAD